MRAPAEYRALKRIAVPGTSVAGYQAGDEVPMGAVENWGLVVGDDPLVADVQPLNTGIIPRPEDDNDRTAWEAYAVGQGMTSAEARAESLPALRKKYPETDEPVVAEPLPDATAGPVRPEDSAPKADWVEFVKRSGADPEWAEAKGTTKADLQGFDPGTEGFDPGVPPTPAQGDPVALDATRQANG